MAKSRTTKDKASSGQRAKRTAASAPAARKQTATKLDAVAKSLVDESMQAGQIT